jgi:hypothetical protein
VSLNDLSAHLDLARGLPTTEQDVAVLRALRFPSMTDAEYVRFLASFAPPPRDLLAAKRGPRGAPFRLQVP